MTTTELWESAAGEISCRQHMGGYATAELEQRPKARRLDTPLTVWRKMTESERRLQEVDLGDGMVWDYLPACESCEPSSPEDVMAATRSLEG